MTRRGLEGDASAARATLDAIEAAPIGMGSDRAVDIAQVLIHLRRTARHDRLDHTIRDLSMARKLDAYRDTARVVLEPWLVELALQRLGTD